MKRLGIDLGTSSLGWAIIDDDKMNAAPSGTEAPNPIDCGVVIFPEGLERDKSDNLFSPATKRRVARAARRLIFRRKLRKFHMLRALMDAGMCPLGEESFARWRSEGRYPIDDAPFMAWLQASEGHNPYADRAAAAEGKVDKLTLGRALYHLAQRRGFKSSKKEQFALMDAEDAASDKKQTAETTQTKQEIDALTDELEKAGGITLGQYFYALQQRNATLIKSVDGSPREPLRLENIRGRKIGRIEHYRKEFHQIAEAQGLSPELRQRFEGILFFQRPLRIQRHTVGFCALEKRKYRRCLVSHPDFEYFRALCFVNNLRIGEILSPEMTHLQHGEGRPLTTNERELVLEVLTRTTPTTIEELLGKKRPLLGKRYYTNYHPKTDAPIMQVRAKLLSLGIPETQWQMTLNAAIDFDDLEKFKEWAQRRGTEAHPFLGLSEERAKALSRFRFSTDRADYSLHALRKIIPYLERGFTLRKATFCAKLGDIIPDFASKQAAILDGLEACEQHYREEKARRAENPRMIVQPLEDYHYRNYLKHTWEVSDEAYKQLYVDITETDESNPVLPPVNLGAIRNPLSYRALTVLRKLINTLRAKGKIDAQTQIFIELARTVNSANQCRAIELEQKEQKKKREEAAQEVQKIIDKHHLAITVNDESILRYLLWEEQNHCSVYTGQPISERAMLTETDIEHTIPRSRGGTSERQNLTLCECHYNRNIKKGKLPTECPNAENEWNDPENNTVYPPLTLSAPIKHWQAELKKLEFALTKKPKRNGDLSVYNAARQKYLVKKAQYDYLKTKLKTFTITREQVDKSGFMPRQLVDTGVITKHAVKFLKARYRNVFTRNGAATAAARKAWGIQKDNEKKSRIDHVHHAVDACVIAALDATAFSKICTQLGHDETFTRWNTVIAEPYPHFSERVHEATKSILVRHLSKNYQRHPITQRKPRVPLDTIKRLKYEQKHLPSLSKSSVVRGSLHNDTLYGKIRINGEATTVLRKTIASAGNDLQKWIKDVVDNKVREALESQVKAYLAQGIEEKDLSNHTYYMPSGIPIKKKSN